MVDPCPFCGWHVDVTPDHCPRCFHGDPPEEPHQKSRWSWLEGVEVLFDEPLEEREFSDWRMGFIDLDGIDVSMLRGYSNFFDNNEEPRAFLKALSRGERLALLFRDLG